MRYYIIAGEASGDIHGANLMRSILEKDNQAKFRFWGGNAMQEISGSPVKHIRELAFMGFWEVISNLKTILGFLSFCKKDIVAFGPDVIVLLDYPGFNLRIAEWAYKNHYKVVYYIVPQVWAWHTSRVKKLKAYTHKLIAILPFEEDFYREHGCDVTYVGHPLLDEIERQKPTLQIIKPVDIAILPGSRRQEIKHMLPIFLRACDALSLTCSIAASNHIPIAFYEEIIQTSSLQNSKPIIYQGQMYSVLESCSFAFVTSGTATLETALMRVPQIVGYKGNVISYQIAKKLIKLNYISLVNLILDRKLVVELIQQQLSVQNLITEYRIAQANKSTILTGYAELKEKLGSLGASERAAVIVVGTAGK